MPLSKGKPLPCAFPSYRQGSRRCGECVSAQQCKNSKERWANLPSLSERAAALEQTFEPDPDEDILQTYRRIHVQMFGWHPPIKRTPKNEVIFAQVQKLCADEGISVELYIRAQMHSMSYWLQDPKRNKKNLAFVPRMLTFKKARHMYNAYIHFRYREYRNVDRPAFSAETYEGKLRSFAYEDELSIGLDYTHGLYSGLAPDFNAIMKAESPSSSWWALIGWKEMEIPANRKHARTLHERLMTLYKEEWILRVRDLLRIRAACEVAETFRHGLADRIGFKGDFSWDAFAKLIRQAVIGREPAPCEDIEDVPGILYER
jgi:hypothetical protein